MTARSSSPREVFALMLTVLAAASSCTSESQMTESQQVEAMAAAYTAAWCSQNPASVAAYFAADGSLRINDGAPAVGREAITASAAAFMTSLPDMVVAMDSVRVNGRTAVYHWTLTGTNTGPGGTGKSVRISGREEWTLDAEGRIATSLGHFDAEEYARQVREGGTVEEHPATAAARAFYAWYAMPVASGGAGFSFERAATERGALFSSDLRAMIDADRAAQAAVADAIVGLDFDPLTASQEPCERYVPSAATAVGDRVRVAVREECDAGRARPTPLTLEFAPIGDAWLVADIVYADGDRLTAILARYKAAREAAFDA